MFIYLAVTGARIEIPAAITVITEGEETQFIDSRGVVVAIFRSTDLLMYSMKPIEPEPLPPTEFSATDGTPLSHLPQAIGERGK